MIGQLEKLAELKKKMDQQRKNNNYKIISLVSGKGGTGKSVLSINLAKSLHSLGNRVLLIDLDLNFANLGIMLNIYSEYSLADYFNGKALFDEVIYNMEEGFDIITGDSGDSILKIDEAEKVRFLFNQLSKKADDYDFIVVDNSAGMNERLLFTIKHSDYCLIVANPEPTSVMDSYVMLKILTRNKVSTEKFILVNKISSMKEGKTAFSNIQEASMKFLGKDAELMGYVHKNDEFGDSILGNYILVEKDPELKSSKQITEIAKKLYDFNHMANNLQSIA